jgi:hypothetical protein
MRAGEPSAQVESHASFLPWWLVEIPVFGVVLIKTHGVPPGGASQFLDPGDGAGTGDLAGQALSLGLGDTGAGGAAEPASELKGAQRLFVAPSGYDPLQPLPPQRDVAPVDVVLGAKRQCQLLVAEFRGQRPDVLILVLVAVVLAGRNVYPLTRIFWDLLGDARWRRDGPALGWPVAVNAADAVDQRVEMLVAVVPFALGIVAPVGFSPIESGADCLFELAAASRRACSRPL